MGFFDKLRKGLGVGDFGPLGLSGILESIHTDLQTSQTAVESALVPTPSTEAISSALNAAKAADTEPPAYDAVSAAYETDTKRVEKFLQDLGRVSNPDEFSEAEAIHPLKRGKKIIFYHASTSPIAPHLKVHPMVQEAIDSLHSAGIIKPEELEAARNPETLLQIIGRLEDGPFKQANADNLRRMTNFLSGEFHQDSASVFHAGTLSAARERMKSRHENYGDPIHLHAYEMDTSMMEPVIYDDEIIVRPPDVDQLRKRKIISLQAMDAQKNSSLITSSEAAMSPPTTAKNYLIERSNSQ